jgi:WD40 repeat protein
MTTEQPTRSDPPIESLPLPLVEQTYGEPRFHTESDIAAVAFGDDGTVYSVDDAGVLQHWAADGKLLHRLFLSDLETLWAFSPGGRLLASANDDLLLWDVPTGQLLARIQQPAWVTAVAFSPDGRALASGHDDGTVRFWDLGSGKLTGELAAHPNEVSAVAFHPSGDRFATAGEDRVVRVWDAYSHKPLGEFVSHTDRVPALAWSADGSVFASAGWDTSARVWQVGSPDPLILLNSHADQVVTLAFSPVGTLVATADSDFDIHLWPEAASGKAGKVLRGHLDEIRCLAFSPDGSRLASAGADRVVHVWNVATGELLAGPNPTGRHAVDAFTRDGKLYLASTGGTTFRLWDAASGAEVAPSGDGPAYSVAASRDGRWLAVGGTDYFTRLYDQSSGAVKRLEATKPPIGSLAVHPRAELVAHTSPADGLVWLWNPETGEPFLWRSTRTATASSSAASTTSRPASGTGRCACGT